MNTVGGQALSVAKLPEKLSDLKESNPIDVAEYAVAQNLQAEPAFNWWVSFVLKKREQIISLVKKRSTRYLKRNGKFDITLPKTVEEVHRLGKKNDNTQWADVIAIEMLNLKVAFKMLDDGTCAPCDYQFVKCHMIYDVKMEGFKRKTRLVTGNHMITALSTVT